MKKILKVSIIAALFFIAPVVLLAQSPPHPNGGSGPTGDNTPVGGGAPVDGGIVMLMALGSAYGAKKVYKFRKGK